MADLPVYVLERDFDAPRDLVWRTWTEAELLVRWYGPNVETVIHKLDVRPGGQWLNEMKMGDRSNYQRMDYIEVDAPERLVGLMANTDAGWNIAADPMMPDWPRVLLTDVSFAETAGKTKMRLVWSPHEASEKEIVCFAAAMDGLGKGWGMGMEMLEQLLAEMQN
ncbi:SRPBCC family protein [Roseibium marinum]|nr:SRPBCC domain-containing protein [Roseibium marinum]